MPTFLKIVKAYKRHLPIRMRVFAYMENIIFLRFFPSSGGRWARAGGRGSGGLRWADGLDDLRGNVGIEKLFYVV